MGRAKKKKTRQLQPKMNRRDYNGLPRVKYFWGYTPGLADTGVLGVAREGEVSELQTKDFERGR